MLPWKMLLAVMMILSSVVLVSGCTGGSKDYDGKYMSFSYPENWQMVTNDPKLVSFSSQDKKLSEATVTVGDFSKEKEQQLIADGYDKDTENGYRFYEISTSGAGGTIKRVGIFAFSNMSYTINLNGDRNEVDNGYDMIVDSFRIK